MTRRQQGVDVAVAVILAAGCAKQTDIISSRVGNYQYNPFWGAMIDQLWVR